MSDTRQYDAPDDIRKYGKLVEGFNQAMKALPEGLSLLKVDREQILSLVGEGPYNSLDVGGQGYEYIRSGPQEHADGMGKSTGLFGAFGIVHLPEMKMANRMVKTLGERHGWKFNAIVNGETYSVPLDQLQIDFLAREQKFEDGKNYEKSGRITLLKPLTLTNEQGAQTTLEEGTVIVQSKEAPNTFGYGHHWTRDADNKPMFAIVDTNGKAFDERDASMMLWLQIAVSHGLKRQGFGSPGINTLMLDGPDDDVDAERHVIERLNALKYNHGIDLMDDFNTHVAASGATLNRILPLLESIAHSIAFADALGVVIEETDAINIPNRQRKQWTNILPEMSTKAAQKLRNVVTALDLKLPEVELTDADHAALEQARDTIIAYHVADAITASIDSTKDALHGDWYNGRGNRLHRDTPVQGFLDALGDERRLPLLQERLNEVLGKRMSESFDNQLSGLQGSLRRVAYDMKDLAISPEKLEAMRARLTQAMDALGEMRMAFKCSGENTLEDVSGQMKLIRSVTSEFNRFYAHTEEMQKTDWKFADLGFARFYNLMNHAHDNLTELTALYLDTSKLGLGGEAQGFADKFGKRGWDNPR